MRSWRGRKFVIKLTRCSLFGLTMLSTACAVEPARTVVVNSCADIRIPHWSLTEQGRMAEEIRAMPIGAAVRSTLLPDAITLRDRVRACGGHE